MITDPIADLLTRIRNAQKAGHERVKIQKSKTSERILNVLKSEGFIGAYSIEPEVKDFPCFVVSLRYYANGRPLIMNCSRISKCGRRKYSRAKDLGHVLSGLGISIISTSQGVMSDKEARSKNIGGEIVAAIS
jgi:small subunit ribosomal protein S8